MATLMYPYDPSGVAETNLIRNELHSVQPPADINQASFIVPRSGPFFANSLEVWTNSNKRGNKLILGRDYFLTHAFVAGSNWLGKPLAGGIAFTNALFAGNVYLDYQTIGGEFTVNDTAILEAISRKHYSDVRFVTWDQLTGVPSAFPADAHEHQVTDIKTFADVVDGLNRIASALIGSLDDNVNGGNETSSLALIRSHISAASNAHTPAAVGLGNVSNFATANEEDAVGLRNDRFMTPNLTGYLIRRYINGENLADVRDTIITIGDTISNIQLSIRNLDSKVRNIDNALAEINNQINTYRREIQDVGVQMIDLLDRTNISSTIASQALSQSLATEANLQTISERVNDVIYTSNTILPTGEHLIAIPPGNALRVELVGAGGGSGRWFNVSSDAVLSAGGPISGEDSILWFLGTASAPNEPLPLLIAGGGLAGLNSYGNLGRSNPGQGGICRRFRKERLKASEIQNIDMSVDYVEGPSATAGKAGTSGDTSNTAAPVEGVGGWTIDASGDLKYKQTYGRGGRGVTRAGQGGSGGRWEITIVNDKLEDIRLVVSVARPGRNARAAVNDEETSVVDKINMAGVAVLTLVS